MTRSSGAGPVRILRLWFDILVGILSLSESEVLEACTLKNSTPMPACESSFLAKMPQHLRQRVLQFSHFREFSAGSTLFLQGDRPTTLDIVVDGCVKLYRFSPSGAEAVVLIVALGGTIGEDAAVNNTAHHMSAQAVDAVTLLRLDAASLRREMRAEPGLAMTVLASIHHQFDMLITEVELLTSRSGLQRVAEFLLVLATCSSGRCSVTIPYSRTLLAARLGMKPESLSRSFGRLRAYGVSHDAGVVHIEDTAALADLTREEPRQTRMREA